jgi:nitrogen fixation protein
MAINRQKISQMTPKGSELDATDLLEVSVDTGSGYETRSITGQEVFGAYVPYTGATQDVDLGEFELKAGQLTLDTSPTGTAAVGTTRWNNTLGSSETTLKGGSVILKNGVDLVARVVNKVTPNATLTKAAYQAVRVSGAQGQRLAVAYAQADNDNNSADTIGLVTETIATNQEGFIITVGHLEEINTTGSLQSETWADGDVLYLSPTTPGALTNVKPTGATGHIVVIGYVEYAHVNHGKIYVKIMNGWELDELHNVYINTGTLANNDALIYESSTQLWKNKTIATALGYTPAPRDVTIDTKTIQYTLVTGDNSKFIELNFSGGNNIKIPTNTAQPFPIGAQIILSQYGAGQVTVVPDTGVTLRSSGGKTKTAAQYAMATLIKRGTNEWYLAGDLTT